MISIRKARMEDIPGIMSYIDEVWEKDHILSVNKELFHWQHVDQDGVNYIIAIDDACKKYYGMMGYIPIGSGKHRGVSTVMKYAAKNDEYELLGEDIMRFFEENVEYESIVCPGLEKRYAKVLRALDDTVIGTMKHYYRLNENKKEYVIAKIENPIVLPAEGTKKLIELKDKVELQQIMSTLDLGDAKPVQDYSFIEYRFLEHPIYKYKLYGIYDKDYVGILVGREVSYKKSTIFRIVDFIGRDQGLSGIANALDNLMVTFDYEYIDFYCYGIHEKWMRGAGFVENKPEFENVIPDYFEPFLQKNGEIYFFTEDKKDIHVYKCFGDQDRPRQISMTME